ncbi:MAG: hypothetical protein KAX54_00195 [Thauera sp.]|nr:hypothetical protein [Thauera sp.]
MADIVPGASLEEIEAASAELAGDGERMVGLARALTWFGLNGTAVGGDRENPLFEVRSVMVNYGGGQVGYGAARGLMLEKVAAEMVALETALISAIEAELAALVAQYEVGD